MVEEIQHLVELIASKSALRDQHGYARVHTVVYEHLVMEEKDHVEVINSEGKAILVSIAHDKLIDKDAIRLGKHDMEKLDLSDGDKVHLKVHKTLADSVTELKDKVLSKLKKKYEEKEEVE